MLLCKKIKLHNLQQNNYAFVQSFKTIESNAPLSASSWERATQLDDAALAILARNTPTPAPQGPLAHLSGKPSFVF